MITKQMYTLMALLIVLFLGIAGLFAWFSYGGTPWHDQSVTTPHTTSSTCVEYQPTNPQTVALNKQLADINTQLNIIGEKLSSSVPTGQSRSITAIANGTPYQNTLNNLMNQFDTVQTQLQSTEILSCPK